MITEIQMKDVMDRELQIVIAIDKGLSFLFDSDGNLILRYHDGTDSCPLYWNCPIDYLHNERGQIYPLLREETFKSSIEKLEQLSTALDWDDNQKAFVEHCREKRFPLALHSITVTRKVSRKDNREREECITLLAPKTVMRNPDEFQFTGIFDIDPKPPFYYLSARRNET